MLRVLIAVIGNTGNEPEAIRQVLESFGCLVLTKYIGRPNDFVSVLSGAIPFDPDIVVLSCHGEGGRIIMPDLDHSVYGEDEPRGSFSAKEIKRYLTLTSKTIINTGCTTGLPDLAAAFSRENSYIAPSDYIAGNAVLLFVVDLFYQMIQHKLSAKDAWNHARAFDEETARFAFYDKVT